MTISTSALTRPNSPSGPRYPGFAPALAIAGSQGGVITYRQAMAAGLTRGQLRQLVHTGQWSHPVRGAFVVSSGAQDTAPDSPPALGSCSGSIGRMSLAGAGETAAEIDGSALLDFDHRRLCARARAALIGRPCAVVCGITAARLQGFPAIPPEDSDEPIHLLLPARLTRAQPRGVRLHFSDLAPAWRGQRCGIPITTPARTLADLVLAARTREDAIVLMDAALHGGAVPDLALARVAAAGRRGSRATLEWWDQADGRAGSELETRLRLLLVGGGIAPPELQWPVTDGTGQLVARLGLAWPAQRVSIEADMGPVPAIANAAYLERHRGNVLASLRWTVLHFSETDVVWHPDRVLSTVTRVLSGRAAEVSGTLRAS